MTIASNGVTLASCHFSLSLGFLIQKIKGVGWEGPYLSIWFGLCPTSGLGGTVADTLFLLSQPGVQITFILFLAFLYPSTFALSSSLQLKFQKKDILGIPWWSNSLDARLSLPRAHVQSLFGKLRSHKPHSMA